MPDRIRESDLRAVLERRIAPNLPGRPFQLERTSGVWNLDELQGTEPPESYRIRHRIHTAASARAMYDWLHAFADGLEYHELYPEVSDDD